MSGKVAVVTGAASGIGRASVVALAREGAAVVLADINTDRADIVADSIRSVGGRALVVRTDVSDSASVRHMVAAAVAEFGAVDAVVHCAVDGDFVNRCDARITELDDQVWARMLDVVLGGTFRVCREAGRQMIAQGSGSIVLMATVDALVGVAGYDSYSAAKGGVLALTRSLAAGLAPEGIRVNAICPAFVASETQLGWLDDPQARAATQRLHLLPIPDPEDIAPFALFLASDDSRAVTGAVFPADAGYLAFKSTDVPMADILKGKSE